MKTGIAFTICVLFAVSGVSADTGRIELNQALINSNGGFPHTLNSPGSYVLTGNLSVPVSTSGLILNSNNISIDLNGFSITGPFNCGATACSSGTADGISLTGTPMRARISNGVLSGFSRHCIDLGEHAAVRDVSVSECGATGISVDAGSTVTGARVHNTGGSSISFADETGSYVHNVVSSASKSSSVASIVGGKATGGNICEDDACTSDGRKRWYLTANTMGGNAPLTACAAGFEMASLWQISDPSTLVYDTTRGATRTDAGSGPPTGLTGWIRTGYASSSGTITEGQDNCSAWSSVLSSYGTVVVLPTDWNPASPNTSAKGTPWVALFQPCDNSARTWCVEK
jgi:hypothetical protein